ncbi:MAG: BT4734/BF3469 family protein [Bacteroidota bacterium]
MHIPGSDVHIAVGRGQSGSDRHDRLGEGSQFSLVPSIQAAAQQMVSLRSIQALMRSGAYADSTEQARELLHRSPRNYQVFKQRFPAFAAHSLIPIGQSKHLNNCQQHSGYIALDYDKLSRSELERSSKILKRLPWVAFVHTSLSGQGLCVLIRTPLATIENHGSYYRLVARELDELLDLKHDPSGRSLNRLRFLCHDRGAYCNPGARPFPIVPKLPSQCSKTRKAEPKDSPKENPKRKNKKAGSREIRMLIRMLEQLRRHQLPLFRCYRSWMLGAYALYNLLPAEEAERWYHDFANLSEGYNQAEVKQKLRAIRQSKEANDEKPILRAGMGTLVYLFRQAVGGKAIDPTSIFQPSVGDPDERNPLGDDRDLWRKPLMYYMPGCRNRTKARRSALLCYIHRHAGMDPLAPHLSHLDQLSKQMTCSKSAMSKDLHALESAGLIRSQHLHAHSLNRSKVYQITEEALHLLCKCVSKEHQAQAAIQDPQSGKSGEVSALKEDVSPCFDSASYKINIPLPGLGEGRRQSNEEKTRKKEFPASEKPSRTEENLEVPQIIRAPDQHAILSAWNRFRQILRGLSGKTRCGQKTAEQFLQLARKYPDNIHSIAQQVLNKPPGQMPYWWLKDECFDLRANGVILNSVITHQDIAKWRQMRPPPAERMVLIRRAEVDFSVLSLQGPFKQPQKVPNGVVYCLSVSGELFVNRDGVKVSHTC